MSDSPGSSSTPLTSDRPDGTPRRARFEALGAYLPATVERTADLVGRLACPPFDLQGVTGIRERRVHAPDEDSLVLAERAALDCLSRSRYRPEELDVIISASISRLDGSTKLCFEPPFALRIKRALGATAASHFDVSNACAGMITGVWLLDRMIRAGIVRNGMVVSGECITPIADTAAREAADPKDPQFASLTVGDAGAAVILDDRGEDGDALEYVSLVTAAAYADLCIGKPSGKGAGLALYTNNHEMHRRERLELWPRFQARYLADRGSSFADEGYDHVVYHQFGTLAMRLVGKFAGAIFAAPLPPSIQCVETTGNTASTSHFVALWLAMREGRIQPGERVLLVPGASGIVTGCLSVTLGAAVA